MNGNSQTAWRRALLAALTAVSLPAAADTSNGPDPYAQGYGFDDPQEAPWGGWQRGDEGTLHAEWDVFTDASHGGASDRSAAPDLGSYGTSSAWLGWNTGSFVAGTGNLYSFTVPEVFSINLAGPVAATSLRVVLQVETQGLLLAPASFRLNGSEPVSATETYRNPAFPSPMGTTDLVQRVYIWDLAASPEQTVFAFSSTQPHVSLTQVAVDIGPTGPAARPAGICRSSPNSQPRLSTKTWQRHWPNPGHPGFPTSAATVNWSSLEKPTRSAVNPA